MSEASTSAAPATPANPCPKCGAPIPPEAPQGLCPKCLLQQASFPTETGAATRHSRPAPPDRDELAHAFPHLQILELIGQGGMGFVYKARQPKLDRLVALKILAQPLAEQTHFAERFTREGRTLAKLNHPNIVTIHDFGQAGPFFYLLMEYVDGVNLRQAMRAGAVNSSQALAIVPRICDALQYAHNEGVLHRDIKPDNILLDTRGRVKIADFGIAKLMAEAVAENPLTGSGASLGTPHYMAPEQIEKPNAVDHRADIYSLGVVFYEMLTGELPLGRFAAPSEKSAIDPRLDEVVFQTLEKEPAHRPQSADEVKTRVETISAAPQSSSATEPSVTFKMTRCSLTTPELLQRRFGPFFRFLHKGDLRVDSENLTFVPRGNWIVMPLRAITSLSLVEIPASTVNGLPWQNTIRGLKLIAVTFTEKGVQHRFLLYPKPGYFIPPTERNRQAEEWFTAIQNAIKARTSRIPPSSNKDCEPLPPEAPSTFLDAALKKIAAAVTIVVLLMVIAFLSYLALIKQPAPLSPQPLKPPKIAINVTAVTVTNVQHIALWTTTDTAADEVFVPVVRYDEGPWSQSDVARKYLEWTTDKAGVHHLGRYDWTVPSGFNSEFQMAAAAAAARARAESGPFPLTIDPTVVFAITNQSGQKFSGGLRLKKVPLPQGETNPIAIVKDLYLFGGSGNEAILRAQASVEIPQGYILLARGNKGNEPLTGRAFKQGALDQFDWKPFVSGTGDKPLAHSELLKIKPGVPTEVYSISDSDLDLHAYLELIPRTGMLPGEILPQSLQMQPGSQPITNSSAISANPKQLSTPTGPIKTLDLMFDYFGPSPDHNINIKALAELANDEQITTTIRYNDADWSFTRYISTWDTEEKLVKLHWQIPENFSVPFDLDPAVTAFFHRAPTIAVQLSTNAPFTLFTVTNGLKQRITLGIAYSKQLSMNSEVTLSNLILRPSGNGFETACKPYLPADQQLYATFTYGDNFPANAPATRYMPNGELTISWKIPDGFFLNQLATVSPFIRGLNTGRLAFTTNSFELFALTNRDDPKKIWRGFLKTRHIAQEENRPKIVDENREAANTRTPKIFEFNSVTNSTDYIVLQSETPMEVGKSLVALVVDSTGKTNRAISGLTVRHTPTETHTTAQLMWKMPVGSPTNWLADTMQKIRETTLNKPIPLSEGESRRLFDLRTVPGSVQQFADVRCEAVAPSKTQTSGTVRVRSAFPMSSGFILHFDADVPPGYRLEAEADPSDGDYDVRLDHSNIAGHDYYHAIWMFPSMSAQDSADLRYSLTNSTTRLTKETFAIEVNKPNPIYTFKTTAGREFHAILKLHSPNEHRE